MPIQKKDVLNYLQKCKVSELKELNTYFHIPWKRNTGKSFTKRELISNLVGGGFETNDKYRIQPLLDNYTFISSTKIPSGDDVLIIPHFLSVSEVDSAKIVLLIIRLENLDLVIYKIVNHL